jgi:hypothetical protein
MEALSQAENSCERQIKVGITITITIRIMSGKRESPDLDWPFGHRDLRFGLGLLRLHK